MSSRSLAATLALPAVALSLAALLAPAAANITYLWDSALPTNPYFVPEHGWLLYAIAPLFAVATVTM